MIRNAIAPARGTREEQCFGGKPAAAACCFFTRDLPRRAADGGARRSAVVGRISWSVLSTKRPRAQRGPTFHRPSHPSGRPREPVPSRGRGGGGPRRDHCLLVVADPTSRSLAVNLLQCTSRTRSLPPAGFTARHALYITYIFVRRRSSDANRSKRFPRQSYIQYTEKPRVRRVFPSTHAPLSNVSLFLNFFFFFFLVLFVCPWYSTGKRLFDFEVDRRYDGEKW